MIRNKILEQLAPLDINSKTKKDFMRQYYSMKTPATYLKNGMLQCHGDKNRSIGDLYYILKAKYKSTTFPETCQIMYELCLEDDHQNIECLFCSAANSIVFFRYQDKPYYSRYVRSRLRGIDLGSYQRVKGTYGVSFNDFMKIVKKRIEKKKKSIKNKKK